MPPGITDKDYVIAQYDGAVAYMDACIQTIFTSAGGAWASSTTRIVVINGDHGETLYDHECYFDHHGLYDVDAARAADHPLPGQGAGRAARGRLQPAQGPGADAPGAGRDRDGHPVRRPEPAADGARRGALRTPRVLHHRMHLDAQARLAHAAVEADRRPGARFPLQAAGRAVQPDRGPARGQQPGRG